MAVAGATLIIGEVSGAILGIISTIKKMDHEHQQKLTEMNNKHSELMLI